MSIPSIGRSLLGESEYRNMLERLAPGEQAILLAGDGRYSFKGSGYVRGGIFDRFQVVQNDTSFRFHDYGHKRLRQIAAVGEPDPKDVDLFITEADLGFQMAGRIGWIGPREGAQVQAGQDVARLDQEELLARKQAAEAQAAAARALLQEMTTGSRPEEIAEGRAALRGAEERLTDAQRDLARTRRLSKGTVSWTSTA